MARVRFNFIFIFAVLLLLSVLTALPANALTTEIKPSAKLEAKPKYYFTTEYAALSAERYSGSNVYLGARYEGLRRASFWLGGRQISKSYEQGATIRDSIFEAGLSAKLTRQSYVLLSGSSAPNAIFSPRSSVLLDPHYAFLNGIDIGIRGIYTSYVNGDYLGIAPSIAYSFSDQFTVALQPSWVNADGSVVSLAGYATYNPNKEESLRLTVAGGKTVEDAGIIDSFSSVAITYVRKINRNWKVAPSFTHYSGDLRKENAIGLMIEVGL